MTEKNNVSNTIEGISYLSTISSHSGHIQNQSSLPNLIKVLAIDDSKMFLHGLNSLLQTEPGIALLATAETGAQAVRRALELNPNVALVDLRIKWLENEMQPDIQNGIRTIRELLQTDPKLAVLVVSSFSEKRWLVQAMDAGATGFLPKECEPTEILTAIRHVYHGRTVLTSEQLKWLREKQGLLTLREDQILQLFAKGQNDEEIADFLHIKVSTVRKHIENIRMKLHAKNRLEAVINAVRKGLA